MDHLLNPHEVPPQVPLRPSRTELNLRTPKACDECRRRKVKCDGESPTCRPCRQRNLEGCSYRSRIRVRRKKAQREGTGASTAHTSDNDSIEDVAGAQEPVSEQVYSSVSAAQPACPAYSVELYYGPSSSFSFLQQIHRRLKELSPHQPKDKHHEIDRGEEGLDRFNYRRLFFGHLAPGQGEKHRGSHSLAQESDIIFLPTEKARNFMQRYLQTNYVLLPIFPEDEFERLLESMYTASGTKIIEKSLVLVALAIGATCIEGITVGDSLFERAKSLFQGFQDIVNVPSIQYQMIVGRPNAAYLLVGSAVRKSFAAGLHRESPVVSGTPSKVIEERRRTFWISYVFESLVCYSLGRPLAISCETVNVPMPEGQPLLSSLVALCRINARSAKEIYLGPNKSLAKLWVSAMRIKGKLEALLGTIDPVLLDIFHGRVHPGPSGIQQVFFFNLYQHTILLTFRPFLLFRTMISSARPHDALELAAEKMKWLSEGCTICIETARSYVKILDLACSTNELVKMIRLNAFYLESSAFVLVYGSLLLDPVLYTENMPYLKLAAKGFAQIEQGFPLKCLSYALGEMVYFLESLGSQDGRLGTPRTPASIVESEPPSDPREQVDWLPGVRNMEQQLQTDYDDIERVNLDFGFDMSAMDFEQFLNRDGLEDMAFMP